MGLSPPRFGRRFRHPGEAAGHLAARTSSPPRIPMRGGTTRPCGRLNRGEGPEMARARTAAHARSGASLVIELPHAEGAGNSNRDTRQRRRRRAASPRRSVPAGPAWPDRRAPPTHSNRACISRSRGLSMPPHLQATVPWRPAQSRARLRLPHRQTLAWRGGQRFAAPGQQLARSRQGLWLDMPRSASLRGGGTHSAPSGRRRDRLRGSLGLAMGCSSAGAAAINGRA